MRAVLTRDHFRDGRFGQREVVVRRRQATVSFIVRHVSLRSDDAREGVMRIYERRKEEEEIGDGTGAAT